eukprot:4878078-Amphidinium_carterae.1
MEHVEPLSPTSHRAALAHERGKDYKFTRSVAPKAGPKPPGLRPPMHGVSPLYADSAHQDAATMLS